MGQVFHVTFVDKNTNSILVMPNPINEWKLMEQCWCNGTVVSYAYACIKETPRRLAWVGDQIAGYPAIHWHGPASLAHGHKRPYHDLVG
jgi:hypothetical protein